MYSIHIELLPEKYLLKIKEEKIKNFNGYVKNPLIKKHLKMMQIIKNQVPIMVTPL
jgi:hypothetical protein